MIPQALEWQAMNKDPNRDTQRFIHRRQNIPSGGFIHLNQNFFFFFYKNANLWFVTSFHQDWWSICYPNSFCNHFTQRFGISLLWKPAACSVYLTIVTFAVHPGAYRWPLQLWLTVTLDVLVPLVWNQASTSGPNMQVKAVTAKQ